MKPVLLLLGDDNAGYATDARILEFEEKLKGEADFEMQIIRNADLWDLESRLKNKEIELDLIIGHSKGRFVSIDYGVPMVRAGFPVYDRAGYYRHPVFGYAGATWLAEEIANVLFVDMEYKKNKEWMLNMW
jgi:nitrogenase molybdenum-iron protein beta chain